MDLTRKSEIKLLLKKYNAKPEKYLGQHFILSKNALKKMAEAAEIKSNDIIIEIGSGLGTLTRELAGAGAKIIAVEKDHLMISILKETLADYKNVKIVQADARKILIPELISEIKNFSDFGNHYKIVANLPYNIATFLIRNWLKMKNSPKQMILMIQKEVAQRICAKPPWMNLLSVSVQFYADVKIIDYVKKESFRPKPKVDAAIIKIVPKKMTFFLRSLEKRHFFRIVKAGFSSPRKQLVGNLSKKLKLSREKLIETFQNSNILSTARAENLSLDEWQKLASKLIHN